MDSAPLTKNCFSVLAHLAVHGPCSQRALAQATGLSLGSVNGVLRDLKAAALVDAGGAATELAFEALAPYKVQNAVIMAAGMSSRFAPLSYERPKGVLKVRGEVLIERQIRQLQAAGIHDIIVVVGYMKEQFFYLEDKFGCRIVVNEEYDVRNNNSTLMLVRENLGNTYICSSDNYFTQNVFEPYVYQAYYAATFFSGPTEEYLLETGTGNRITAVRIGGSDAYGMLGHAYFDRGFSKRFCEILVREYDKPETAPLLWEDIFAAHVSELAMVMRPYGDGVVWEFDSLDDLQAFDEAFVENVDSSILDNICGTLGCQRADIRGIKPINRGLSNLSFRFSVDGSLYVYRHPGMGTEAIVDRRAETFSQEAAFRLGLDDTYLHEDPISGWKISRYLPHCEELDYSNRDQVKEALRMVRTLHESGVESEFSFDLFEETQRLLKLLDERHWASFPDFKPLDKAIADLAAYLRDEGSPRCLCHNDFYNTNLLVADGKMHLIDWEYSGMSDYASDLGTFICCSRYGLDGALEVLREYFQRELTSQELAHCLAYTALASYYWFIWALYKDACGTPVGEWLYLWYKAAKLYSRKAAEVIDR